MTTGSDDTEGVTTHLLEDSSSNVQPDQIPHIEPTSETQIPFKVDAPPVAPIPVILDQIVRDISAIKDELANRFGYDKVKEEAFDRLYKQLDELRSDREFDHLKPLYLDLILLFDRLDQAAVAALQLENAPPTGAVLASLREELVEVLYRREIELVAPSLSTFDPTLQRAIGTQDTDTSDKHNSVGAVVRRGFRYRGRLLRPEEVILNKFRTQV